MMVDNKNYSLSGRIGVIGAGFIVVVLFLFDAFRSMDHILVDHLASLRERLVPSNIIVIEIDSQSLDKIKRWPWNRQLYAQVLDKLRSANVNSVFVDVDFSALSDPADDQILANAMAALSQTAKVRLPIFVQPRSATDYRLNLREPLPVFAQHADLVSVNIQPGNDGLVRQLNAGFILKDVFYSSVWNAIAGRPMPSTYVDFSLSPASFQYLSFADLLEQQLDASQLGGKDVLLGSTAIELGDIVPVPVYKSLPGVVLHGLAIETLLRGGLYDLSSSAAVLLLVCIWILSVVVVTRLNWHWGLLAVMACSFGALALTYVFYDALRLLLPGVSLAIMAFSVYVAGLIGKIDLSAVQNLWLRLHLVDRDKLLASIFSAANDSIICVDANGFITSANDRSREIFACESKDMIGRSLGEIMPVARRSMKALPLDPFETNIVDANFHKVPIEVCVNPVRISGKLSYTLAVRNLKERKERELALSYAASHDKLTGLFNRERFFELADENIARYPMSALLKLDIDYFNEINEVYGHDFGDKVLKILSTRIVSLIDSRSFIGRIGKDDFAILVRNRRSEEAKLLAEKILAVVNQPFCIDEQVIDIFCHIGIARVTDPRSNIEELIRLANVALQAAKTKGLEYDFCYDVEQITEPQRLNIIGAIRNSLQRDTFDLAFQPKVRMDTGDAVGCEVLLRPPVDWNPEVPVFKLIEVAESTRLIADLTLKVVDKVLAMEADWQALNLTRQISINLSLGLLANDQFITTVIKKLDQSIGYFRFEFEITETSFTQNWEQSINNIDRLMTRNVSLAIDDFGTGYSSLAYLRDLRARVLKIDRSFVSNIHMQLENQSIVQSTIKMAHELGMSVVAEGIELPEERDFLIGCHCDHGQGFLFARPMYYPQFATWFSSRLASNIVMLPRSQR